MITEQPYNELNLIPSNTKSEPEQPQLIQVPEPKSLSHARKIAKILFGLHARIWVRQQLGDFREVTGVTYEVGTEHNGRKKIYGVDENLRAALQQAVVQVAALELGNGKLPRDIFRPTRLMTNPPTRAEIRAMEEVANA